MKLILIFFTCANTLVCAEENIITKIQARLAPEPGAKSIVELDGWIGRAVGNIKDLPEPWTVETLIAMHDDPRFSSKRADLVMLLAASKDEKGIALIGKYIETDKENSSFNEMHLVADVYRAVDVFLVDHSESIRLHGGYGGNLESSIKDGKEWWKEYKKIKQDQGWQSGRRAGTTRTTRTG